MADGVRKDEVMSVNDRERISYRLVEVEPSNTDIIRRIGQFRYELWCGETEVNHSLFPQGLWIEDIDYSARHWVVFETDSDTIDLHSAPVLGVARLTVHDNLSDNPDGYIWIRNSIEQRAPSPVGHFCKLAVSKRARGLGIGRLLSEVRIDAAKKIGAKSIIVTASENNARILKQLGFIDTGIRETFPNRPNFEFAAMDILL